ncbi:MAG: hypothetical protein ACK55I_34075, partial [bacterium]
VVDSTNWWKTVREDTIGKTIQIITNKKWGSLTPMFFSRQKLKITSKCLSFLLKRMWCLFPQQLLYLQPNYQQLRCQLM